MFNTSNGTTGFYIDGCISPVANTAVSQIMGIGIINICMAILVFVFLPVLIKMFPQTFDPSDPNNKQPLTTELHQVQQLQMSYPDSGYYGANSNVTIPYTYPIPAYTVYH